MSSGDRIRDFYEERIASGATGIQAVGWGSVDSQARRFEVLVDSIDLREKRILDIGCGAGDILEWFHTSDADIDNYVGLDLSPSLIEGAKERHPTATFIVGDALTAPLPRVDVAICSGAMSFRVQDNLERARLLLKRLYDTTNDAVAMNFLTDRVDWHEPKNFHFDPGWVMAEALRLTPHVVLRHDYGLYEFTAQLRHNARVRP